MAKDPSRKPKRRRPSTVEIDDDLAELASVLDGNRDKIGLDGWLSMPWRSGWCAAILPLSIWDEIPFSLKRGHAIADCLRTAINEHKPVSKVYEQADESRTELVEIFVHGDNYASLLMATARCIQIEIANSSGGGRVFNEALYSPLRQLDARVAFTNVNIEACVLEARCRDAIGVTAQLRNDRFDRERRAFAIAWKRGLYQAAYSIPFCGAI